MPKPPKMPRKINRFRAQSMMLRKQETEGALQATLGDLGMTQAELAERLGVSRSMIGFWVSGRNWPMLEQIAMMHQIAQEIKAQAHAEPPVHVTLPASPPISQPQPQQDPERINPLLQ